MAIVTTIDKSSAIVGDTITLSTSGVSAELIRPFWLIEYDSSADEDKSIMSLMSLHRIFCTYDDNTDYAKTLNESNIEIRSLTPIVIFLQDSRPSSLNPYMFNTISDLLTNLSYKDYVYLGETINVWFGEFKTEYYVNITEEEIAGLEGASVKLECGDENKVSIVSSSDYADLRTELDDYKKYAITDLVDDVLDELSGETPEYSINYSQWSGGLKNIEDDEAPVLTLSDINNAIQVLQTLRDTVIYKSNVRGFIKSDGSVDPNTYVTDSKLSNYVQKSATTGLLKNNGTVDENKYAISTHKHGGNWKSKTMNSYCWIRYNEDLRIVYFRYARANYKFPNTGTITLHSKLMKDFKPLYTTPLSGYHYDIVALIEGSNDGDGTMKISSNETKIKHYLSFTGVWVY